MCVYIYIYTHNYVISTRELLRTSFGNNTNATATATATTTTTTATTTATNNSTL